MQKEFEKYRKATTKVSAKDVIESLKGKLTNASGLQPVKTGPGGTIVVPISDKLEIAAAHYLDDEDGKRYILCNGDDCTLCQVKDRRKTRYLLPVCELPSKTIGVLAMSDSMKLDALLPQILPILENITDPPQEALLITRNDYEYAVGKCQLPPDAGKGIETVIKKFNALEEKGEIDLTSILSRYSNERMRQIPSVAEKLKFFGS